MHFAITSLLLSLSASVCASPVAPDRVIDIAPRATEPPSMAELHKRNRCADRKMCLVVYPSLGYAMVRAEHPTKPNKKPDRPSDLETVRHTFAAMPSGGNVHASLPSCCCPNGTCLQGLIPKVDLQVDLG